MSFDPESDTLLKGLDTSATSKASAADDELNALWKDTVSALQTQKKRKGSSSEATNGHIELDEAASDLLSKPPTTKDPTTKVIEGSKGRLSSRRAKEDNIDLASPRSTTMEKPHELDPDGKLQTYYDAIAEGVSPEVAHMLVWKGAAHNAKIKSSLSTIVHDQGYLTGEEAGRVAKLFSKQLESDQSITDEFTPALIATATCGWEEIEEVAIYMLAMLLNKTKKYGIALVTAELSSEGFHHMLGEAVKLSLDKKVWPRNVVKPPKPDTLLSKKDFTYFLTREITLFRKDGKKTNWLLMLAYSVEGVQEDLAANLEEDFPWVKMFHELSDMKDVYDKKVLAQAGAKFVKLWGLKNTFEERKTTLATLKDELDHKEFEIILDVIVTNATFQLDDLEGTEDKKCLVVTCPTTQLAVKLCRHNVIYYEGDDFEVEEILDSLVNQKISDQRLAAVVRAMAEQNLLTEEIVESMIYSFSAEGLLQSCAELLRISPYPRTHPIVEIFTEKDEKTSFKALELLTPDLYAPNCRVYDNNALHMVATYGYTSVVKEILARGFSRLLNEQGDPPIYFNGINEQSIRPVTVAIQAAHFTTASVLIKAMEPEDVKMLCIASSDVPDPEINLHKVMKEIKTGRGGRWNMESVRDKGEFVEVAVRLEKNEIQERVEFMESVLDTTVDDHNVDLTLLIQDDKGSVPSLFGGYGGDGVNQDAEAAKKKVGKTLYHRIAQSECEDLKSHECFATLTSLIWIDYGIVQGLLFAFYLMFMLFLTTSLVLAARSDNPSQYNSPLDWFRLFCEIVTFILVIRDFLLESYEFFQVIHRSLKEHFPSVFDRSAAQEEADGSKKEQNKNKDKSEDKEEEDDEEEENDDEFDWSDEDSDEDDEDDEDDDGPKPYQPHTNPYIGLIGDVVFEYFLNWQNILDNLAILFILLIIPFRIVGSDTQWVFAALAFMFHGLRIFKYAIMFKSVGEYVAILILLIKRDVPQFLVVFIVIIFSLGGALYLSLIGYYNDDNMDTENNNETSEIYRLWGTGFRILAEGSVLTYYGPGGFNWLGILIYWLFLFIVVVVMLNILIAQFSKSYEEEKERAQINVILTRIEIILKMERSAVARPCVRIVRKIRTSLLSNPIEYESVDRLKGFIGERENDKPASSEQLEELQSQTTNLGLQLRKQMDDNTGKSNLRVEEIKTEVSTVGKLIKDTREELKGMKGEIDSKLIGLERAVIDTRKYVDEIKELLLSMKK